MMSGVTAPVGYVPIESDIYISAELVPGLSSDELGRAASDTVLQQGVEYYVQATGRYMIHDANGNGLYDSGTDRWADAEFFQQQSAQNQNDRWVDHGLAPTPANAGAWGFRLGIDDGDPATADDTRQINFLNQYQNARQTGRVADLRPQLRRRPHRRAAVEDSGQRLGRQLRRADGGPVRTATDRFSHAL